SLSMAPVNIFKHGADEEKAETARLSSFIGAIAIGDLVKSTLGPKGMDKILLGGGKAGTVTVTNDGATILKAIGVDNPAAKVLVDMSKVQDDEVGDGTTSVTVLAAELLRVRLTTQDSAVVDCLTFKCLSTTWGFMRHEKSMLRKVILGAFGVCPVPNLKLCHSSPGVTNPVPAGAMSLPSPT
uniref:Uncharacterized protein n=1 Tax=Periophthalmus magnuspinnatus TaxID=409849 RepID=A0A3B4AUJ5_9GOBI